MKRSPQRQDNVLVVKKNRQSNLELLRIVAMLLVILTHYVATVPVTTETINSNWLGSTAVILVRSLSVVCVNCFICISGYFGITWKVKSFLSLIYQILFWLIIVFAGFVVLGYHYELFGIIEIGKYFSCRWFVPAYLGLYLLAPLINAFIEKANSQLLGQYILLFYLFSTLVGYLLISQEFNEGMSVISLVGLYLIGAFLRRTDWKIFNLKPKYNLSIYLFLAIILAITNIVLLYFGINKSPIGYLNPIVILMSIYLFLFFQKLKIGYIKVINWIAASAFAVFLFHFHPAIYGIFQNICRQITMQGWFAPLWIALLTIAIFIISVVMDQIRKFTFKLFYRK